MNPRETRLAALLPTLLILAVTLVQTCPAATYRIASWNLQSLTVAADAGSAMESRMNTAGLALRQLKPDVVLLQEVPDFATATRIASAMGPGHFVRVCSAFPGMTHGQVGIISKHESAVAWSETLIPGTEPGSAGGYAFAALRLGDQTVGFFSIQPAPPPPRLPGTNHLERTMGSVLGKIQNIQGWQANRAEEFFIATSSTSLSGKAIHASLPGFTGAFLDQPPAARQTRRVRTEGGAATPDNLFVNGGGFPGPATVSRALVSDHGIILAEWDPAAEMPPGRVPTDWQPEPEVILAGSGAGETSDRLPAVRATSGELLLGVELKWWVAGLGVLVCLILFLNLARLPGRRPTEALALRDPDKILQLPESRAGGSLTRADMDRLREEARPHFLGWLREKFIAGLLSRNRNLEETQHHAADKAYELSDRLQVVQSRLVERTRKAEHRVLDLEKELAAAKTENRELIQENLFLAQRELEEARRRVEAASRGQVS